MLTNLETGDRELGDRFDHLQVVLHFDELAQLVVGLEAREQTTKLVVVARVRQTLK